MSDWIRVQLLAGVNTLQAERAGHIEQAQSIATVLVSPSVFKNVSVCFFFFFCTC